MLPFHGGDPSSNLGRGVPQFELSSFKSLLAPYFLKLILEDTQKAKRSVGAYMDLKNPFCRGWLINLHKKGKLIVKKPQVSYSSKRGRSYWKARKILNK